MDILIDFDYGSETAAADATHGFKGEAAISCGLAIMDVQLFLYLFMNLVSASDVARGAQTHRNEMASARLQRKRSIEGRDSIDLAQGNTDLFRKIGEARLGEVIVAPLYRLKNHDQIFFVIPKLGFDQIVQFQVIQFIGRSRLNRIRLIHSPVLLCDLSPGCLVGARDTSRLIHDGAVFNADAAACAQIHVDAPGPLSYFHFEISRASFYGLKIRVSDELDIEMPADLDQFGGDNSHGAVVGGEGLIQLSHGPADGRRRLEQIDIVP